MNAKTTLWLILTLIGLTACKEDLPDTPFSSSEGKTVQVSLSIGFAPDATGSAPIPPRAAAQSPTAEQAAFDARLAPRPVTRAADLQPDALYELHILQFEPNGNLIGSVQYKAGATPIGEQLDITLSPRDDCQLLLIARGEGNISPSISGNLASIRNLSMPQSVFDAIPATGATQAEINKMPYLLHLAHIKVADAGNGKGTIQNVDGTTGANSPQDARLRLRRLAAKLTVNWTISQTLQNAGYYLKEVRLCQVPALFGLLPPTEETQWGTAYPTAVSDFTDPYRLVDPGEISKGSKTIWIPANVRGTSLAATSPIHRTKKNAPIAASYLETVVDNVGKNERLYYRAYLGGEASTDFNLRENTDYAWSLRINNANYATDPRIQFFDQTPVKSTNRVNTANCLMLQPGGNLCFNPYKQVAGTNGWNDYLVDTPDATPRLKTPVDHVKVLWQMKDNGTSGDLVMGYVIDEDNHVNLVNLSDPADIDKALVHVKAPVTNGGNAVIAAYDASDNILWSWHLWITNYVPKGIDASTDYATAQKASRGGTVHQYANTTFQTGGLYADKVTMDRNLGATAGDFPGENASVVEFVRRCGVLYQWGRKDPTFASVDGTSSEKNILFDGFANPISIQRASYNASMLTDGNTILYTIRHPLAFIIGTEVWYNGSYSAGYRGLWNNNGAKTIYDPCPDGWKVPDKSIWSNLSVNNSYWFDSNSTFVKTGSNHTRGGRRYNLNGANGVPAAPTPYNTAWFPTTGYREHTNGNIGIPTAGYLFGNTIDTSNNKYYYLRINNGGLDLLSNAGIPAESEATRCVQE